MSAHVPAAVNSWPPQYAALLETYAARPSAELLQRAAELGRALGQARLPLHDLAATHMSALGDLVGRHSTPSHHLLAAATPLFCCLVEAYDATCAQAGPAEACVGRGTGRDGGPPTAPGASSESAPDLEALLSNLPGLAYRRQNDRHWTMEFVSEGCCELTGYQPADLTLNAKLSYADLIHPDDRERVWDEVQAALAAGRPFQLFYRIRSADGGEKCVWEQGRGTRPKTGDLSALEGFIADVGERKQDEAALRENEQRFRAFFEDLGDAVYRADAQGNITYVNKSSERLTGLPPEDLIGKPFLRLFTSQSQLVAGDAHHRTLKGDSPEYELTFTGGRTCWFKNEPIRDEDGYIVGVFGIARDITERKPAEEELRRHREHLEELVEQRTLALERTTERLQQGLGERKRTEEALRESEARYRSLVENIDLGITLISPDRRILMANAALGKMFNKPVHEFAGKNCFAEFEKRGAVCSHCPGTRAMATGRPAETTTEGVRDDGSRFSVRIQAFPLFGAAGEPTGFIEVVEDITESKRAEQVLQAERDHSTRIINGTPAIVCGIAPDGTTTFVNPAGERITGYRSAELVGRNWWRVFYPGNEYRQVEQLFRDFERGDVRHYEMVLTTRDGERRTISWSSINRLDEGGKLVEIVGFGNDVTERRQVEELLRIQRDVALALSETTDLTEALDQVLEAAFRIDGIDGGDVCLVDEVAGEMHLVSHKGLPSWFVERTSHFRADSVELRQILEGKPLYDRYLGVSAGTQEALQRAGVRATATIPVHNAGQIVASLHLASFTQDDISLSARHTLEAIAARLGSVVARVRAVTALRQSEERFDLAVRGPADGLWDWNAAADGATWWSPRYFELLGYEDGEIEADFNKLEEVLHPDDREATMEAVRAHLEERVPYDVEYRLKTKSGQYRWFRARGQALWDEDGRATRMAGSLQDINDRKGAEEAARRHQEQLAHVSRVSTMGEMASGLAHELAQPLSAILYYARSCASRLHTGAWGTKEAANAMRKIATQADRAAEFIRRLKAFVRKARPHRAPADLNAVVREALGFAAFAARDNQVTVKLELGESLPSVVVDTIQIEQVILNLVRNGIEALVSTPAGEREVLIRTSADSDDAVCVCVQDAGPGLTPEVAEHVFDPFFTTKPTGMGLGLSISRSIIEAHEGTLWVGASPARGAVFGFTLPAARDEHHDGS